MTSFAIDFEWQVDEEGYDWVPGAQCPPEEELSPAAILYAAKGQIPDRIIRRGGKLRTFRPLDEAGGMLHRIFASAAGDRDALLSFVCRYGPLMADGNRECGDDAVFLMSAANSMAEMLAGYAKDPKYYFATYANGLGWSRIDVKLAFNPMTQRPQYRFVPPSLYNALIFEFGQIVTSDAQLRQCEQCGIWFEAGAGTTRRADAKFCSDEHRILFNSLKRTPRKAT
jgi:hypothetical protein